ncbi:MAG TPA: helix-turn-helix domain-containing protein [Solirubrobacterales bacterium]
MENRIGGVLREARNRRKIDLSEVETATRIRARYLRAIENEEWDVLPGGVYTRGFIRTYASFLGLDGERLAEDYRKSVEGGQRGPVLESAATSASAQPPKPRWPVPRASWVAIPAVLLVAVIAIVAIPSGDDDGSNTVSQSKPSRADHPNQQQQLQPPSHGVSVRLAASAEVWVCVLDAHGKPVVNGQILETGAEEGPFRSGSFTVSFGNGEVSMLIDGREAEIPATSSPIGYSIDSSGGLTELAETERPTCT